MRLSPLINRRKFSYVSLVSAFCSCRILRGHMSDVFLGLSSQVSDFKFSSHSSKWEVLKPEIGETLDILIAYWQTVGDNVWHGLVVPDQRYSLFSRNSFQEKYLRCFGWNWEDAGRNKTKYSPRHNFGCRQWVTYKGYISNPIRTRRQHRLKDIWCAKVSYSPGTNTTVPPGR